MASRLEDEWLAISLNAFQHPSGTGWCWNRKQFVGLFPRNVVNDELRNAFLLDRGGTRVDLREVIVKGHTNRVLNRLRLCEAIRRIQDCAHDDDPERQEDRGSSILSDC